MPLDPLCRTLVWLALLAVVVAPSARARAEDRHAPVTTQQLRATATFADGSQRDVTHLVRFSINTEAVATVSAGGCVTKVKSGEVAVAAQYMDQFATARVAFLSAAPDFRWPNPPE